MPGVWYLGRTPTKRSLFIAFGRDSVLAPGLIAALRATEHKLPITLIGPAVAAAELRRFAEADVHYVSTADAFAIAGPAFALDLPKLAPPASIEPKLTLFRLQSKMVFEGRELELPPISFKLLWLLAERVVSGDGMVSRVQVEKHLWSTVVRKTAAADAIRNLRDALRKLDEGGSSVNLVRTLTTQGYILNLTASDIRLVD
jgi:DNA-binding response OmpR family regulator